MPGQLSSSRRRPCTARMPASAERGLSQLVITRKAVSVARRPADRSRRLASGASATGCWTVANRQVVPGLRHIRCEVSDGIDHQPAIGPGFVPGPPRLHRFPGRFLETRAAPRPVLQSAAVDLCVGAHHLDDRYGHPVAAGQRSPLLTGRLHGVDGVDDRVGDARVGTRDQRHSLRVEPPDTFEEPVGDGLTASRPARGTWRSGIRPSTSSAGSSATTASRTSTEGDRSVAELPGGRVVRGHLRRGRADRGRGDRDPPLSRAPPDPGRRDLPAGALSPPRRGSRRWSRTDGYRRAGRGNTSSRTLPSGRPRERKRTEWRGAPTRDRAPR